MKRQEEEAQELEQLNHLRQQITDMLEPLLIKEATGEAQVRALYDFIVRADIENKLAEYEAAFTAQGNLVKAKEYAQIYRFSHGTSGTDYWPAW